MSSTKVRVVVRVRPVQLADSAERVWVHCINDSTLHTLNHRKDGQMLAYDFQSIFNPKSGQRSVYSSCVQGLLSHLFSGENASVFAYGPTGAGKTHTILGPPSDPGIIPRAVRDIVDMRNTKLAEAPSNKIQLSFSYLEIYQEKVIDLLSPGAVPDLPIREDYDRNIFISGLQEREISSVDEFNLHFAPASKNRSTAATKLNSRSSRSHSVLILKVKVTLPGRTLTGKLHIIDLAGSEDNRRTGNQGERLRESGAINTSLLALSQVVDALNTNQLRVPYRGSKLTRLLQDSLGGNSHSCMIVNLAPEERYYYDTYVTLNFARKTKKIVNTVKTNEVKDKSPKMMVKTKKRPVSDSAACQENLKSTDTPPKKPRKEVLPFLSPLIKNQANFKKEMVDRLQNFESRIMEQMKTQMLNTENSEPPSPQKSKRKSPRTKSTAAKGKIFRDGSSILSSLQDVTSSPLFIPPSKIKRKAFRSSAAPIQKSTPESSGDNHDLQQKHNEKILSILNSTKTSEIKKLQTIGQKKADVIVQWTSLNGPLQTFEDLRKAGFSAATVHTFLTKNLVQFG